MNRPVPRIKGEDPKVMAGCRAAELAGIRGHFPGATIEVSPDGIWTAGHGCGEVHEEAGMGALHMALRRCGGEPS